MTVLLRFVFAAALAVPIVAFDGSARATTLTTAQLEAAVCPHHPSTELIASLKNTASDFQCSAAPADRAPSSAAPPHKASSTSVAAKGTPPPKTIPPYAEYHVNTYFIRNDWSDLGLMGTGCFASDVGVPVDKATGAAVSFTRDYAGNNKIWAAQGMAAAVFSTCRNIPPELGGSESGVFEKSIAIYAQINSDYNSNAAVAKKNNLDTRTAGLAGEVAYVHGLDYNVIRVTPNVVFDNIKNTTIGAVNVQYVPVWLSLPGLWSDWQVYPNVYFQFDPTLDLQYASAMEHSQPLQFSGKDQSLRIGPELTFLLKPFGEFASSSDLLSHIGFTETFHPWYDAYGRASYWWKNSIFYDFTENFAVALSYNRGLDENSGTMTNQYIASLTGKY